MAIKIYDFEVFKHDWLVVIKDITYNIYTVFHNNSDELRDFITSSNDSFVGFNSNGYDQHIMRACLNGFTPEEVKELNDFIISGNNGWNYPKLQNSKYYKFNNVDIKLDMYRGLSLKSIEAHMYLSILESSIPFNIDRPLTQEELKEVIRYCKYDVDTTHTLYNDRNEYLSTKMYISERCNLTKTESLNKTTAQLTALLLDAKRIDRTDERKYKYPDNLDKSLIQKEVISFFDRLQDKTISDEKIWLEKLDISINKTPITVAYGGLHGALKQYQSKATDTYKIVNYDIASYYPNLMIHYNYLSRNITNPVAFKQLVEERLQAKASGDKSKANKLKAFINITYGAMLDKYNDLYDPLQGRSVCITGQLFMLALANTLVENVKSLNIIQINTDGICMRYHSKYDETIRNIISDWEKVTHMTMERDDIYHIIQKDVNNYIAVFENGKVKTKGSYLTSGTSYNGAYTINNNIVAIKQAIIDYFVKGIKPEKTISDVTEPKALQIIARASSKYENAFIFEDNQKKYVNKCNRVYASKDITKSTIYKTKKGTQEVSKIPSLPEHCVIDNDNNILITDIDKQYYINLAWQQINDFIPQNTIFEIHENKEEIMEEKQQIKNVFEKLIDARVEFTDSQVVKSGKNMDIQFKYFELDDIVPVANKIFKKVGLVHVVNILENKAILTLYNTEKPTETILFEIPFVKQEPILNKMGKPVTSNVQCLGASITYTRRYLYMVALDIVENDDVDSGMLKNTTEITVKESKQTPPPTRTERTEIVKELTNSNEKATEFQVIQLKKVLAELKEKDEANAPYILEIALDTKSFTEMTKKQCESYIKEVVGKLNEK